MEFARMLEERVCDYLALRGFEVVAKNLKVAGVEIDLLMEKNNVLFVFEVKSLGHSKYKDVRVSANQKKRQHLALEIINRDYGDKEVRYFWTFVGPCENQFLEVHFW